jgi:N-acetylmuramic acid 6-phosphate (MurNAc-6-P) etherase
VSGRCLGALEYYAFVPNVAMAINSAANFGIYVIFAKGFRKKIMKLIKKNKVEPHSGTEMIADSVRNSGGTSQSIVQRAS